MFAHGEGIWFGNSEVYFACTSGGTLFVNVQKQGITLAIDGPFPA